MSRMLTLTTAAWASARELAARGRRKDALAVLAGLLARPDLPPGIATEAHRLAGALYFKTERYASARRHLLTAARAEPGHAETYYQLGIAFEDDPYGCDTRAARRFRKATRLDPTNATYWVALGRAAVRVNRVRYGLSAVQKAVALAPTDAAVLAVAVEALRDAGRPDRAWRVMCKARFLAPADAGLRRLWDRVKYDLACGRQERPLAANPSVLPFVRVVSPCGASRVVRRDGGSRPAPHFGRLKVHG
jgi:Flp pilus assembly protein TadD